MGDTIIVFVSLPTMHGHKIVTWSQNYVQYYRFRHQWLIEDYNSHDKIEQQRLLYAISKSEKKALLGVLSRDGQHGLVKVPSPKDLKFLNELYTHGTLDYNNFSSRHGESSS